MGRYRIIPGPPVHKSSTCRIIFAEDLTNNRLVALKIMKHRHQFKAEIDARYNNGSPLSSSFVISLLGWHCPAGDPISDAGGQAPWEEATETSEEGGEATYVLVMPQGERSLHDACAKERIAGIDADAVVAIVQQLAECLAYLHSMGTVHMDIKQRNVIRLADGRFILCDMVIRECYVVSVGLASDLAHFDFTAVFIYGPLVR